MAAIAERSVEFPLGLESAAQRLDFVAGVSAMAYRGVLGLKANAALALRPALACEQRY